MLVSRPSQRTSLAARIRTLPYWPGADVLSRGFRPLKASGLSLWQVISPRLQRPSRCAGPDKPFMTEQVK